jgi:nitroreductase
MMKTAQILASNETLRTIFERRAVRKFLPEMPEDDVINKIIGAGLMAPSAMNRQPWKFYIATHQDTIAVFSKEIARVAEKAIRKATLRHPLTALKTFLHFSPGPVGLEREDPIFHGAPVVIFITSPRDNEWAGLDIGMCAQNMMLAARSLGLDTCPVGFAKYMEQTVVYNRLEVPVDETVVLAIVMGYAAEKPQPHPRTKTM